MGAKFLAAAFEGDFCDRLALIATAFGQKPMGEARVFPTWDSVAPYVADGEYATAAVSGAWTVVLDYEGSIAGAAFRDPDLATAFATRHSTRVVLAYGNSVSGMYGFRVHSPDMSRAVLVDQDEVVEDEGQRLPGEDPVIADEYNEESVLHALSLLGIDLIDGVESASRAALLQLAENGDWT